MLLNSLYDDAAPTAVDEPPTESPTPTSDSAGSGPLIVVGVALVLGIAAAKWIAWGSKE